MVVQNTRNSSQFISRVEKEEKDRKDLLEINDVNVDIAQTPVNQQTNAQLVRQAVRTHEDTTYVAQRALKVVEETQEIQTETMVKLQSQGERMQKIDSHFREMNEEIGYAEKLLSYMKMCCCCWMFDSCLDTDPEIIKKKDWRKTVDSGQTRAQADQVMRLGDNVSDYTKTAVASKNPKKEKEAPPPAPQYRNPDVRLPSEFRSQEMYLQDQTRKQNDILDQIQNGLSNLLDGAKEMNEEIQMQNKTVEFLDTKAEFTKDRVNNMNQNSQLRQFRLKK